MFFTRLRHSLDMIRFEHSVFALPFALTGAALAFRVSGIGFARACWIVAWIVVAMVSARSAAMAFNRVVDLEIDRRNPRTSSRHLPAGTLSVRFAWAFIAAFSLLFFFATWELNGFCLRLAPVALCFVFFYSFTKRFTSLSHLVLGFCLGIAPAAAWVAVRGSLDPRILLLTAAVMFWTAGFDIIYSCQDYDFDRSAGLFSLPSRIGPGAGPDNLPRAARPHDRFPHRARRGASLGIAERGRHCSRDRATRLRAKPGAPGRFLTGERRLFHHERLGERCIFRFLGRRYSVAAPRFLTCLCKLKIPACNRFAPKWKLEFGCPLTTG